MAAAIDLNCKNCAKLRVNNDHVNCDICLERSCCRLLANDVSSWNDNKSAINLNDSKCYLIKETVTTIAQETKECDRNLSRALAQFQSEDNEEYYSHLFGECDYYTIESINKAFFHKNNDDLFMIHFNIRSLQKHIETLNNFLSQLAKQPDIIALSETKLRDGCILGNINLHGYKFNYVDSLTNAGGVGLYIKDCFQFSVNANVQCELSVAETSWIDITLNNSSVVIAVVYRHPGSGAGDITRFNDSMQKMLDTANKKKRPFYIMGDFNIDLLKISNNETIRQYANTLLRSMCKCLIDLPTRVTTISKTLIDHIYSNDTKSRINSGILVTDISDHFPVFAIISKMKPLSNKLAHYYVRDMNKFDHEILLEQLNY